MVKLQNLSASASSSTKNRGWEQYRFCGVVRIKAQCLLQNKESLWAVMMMFSWEAIPAPENSNLPIFSLTLKWFSLLRDRRLSECQSRTKQYIVWSFPNKGEWKVSHSFLWDNEKPTARIAVFLRPISHIGSATQMGYRTFLERVERFGEVQTCFYSGFRLCLFPRLGLGCSKKEAKGTTSKEVLSWECCTFTLSLAPP